MKETTDILLILIGLLFAFLINIVIYFIGFLHGYKKRISRIRKQLLKNAKILNLDQEQIDKLKFEELVED